MVHFGTLWHQTELQGLAFGLDKWCLGPALPPSWRARNRFGSHQAVVRIRFGYQGSVSGGGPRKNERFQEGTRWIRRQICKQSEFFDGSIHRFSIKIVGNSGADALFARRLRNKVCWRPTAGTRGGWPEAPGWNAEPLPGNPWRDVVQI